MNWEALAAIGEIAGALAVVVTLVYLAAQIRQNTRSVTTAVYESALDGFNALNRDITTNAELASIVRRGAADPSTLNEDEAIRFSFHVRMLANHLYKMFRLSQKGALPEAEWMKFAREAAQIFAMPGYRDFQEGNLLHQDLWTELAHYEVEDFVELGFKAPEEMAGKSNPAS